MTEDEARAELAKYVQSQGGTIIISTNTDTPPGTHIRHAVSGVKVLVRYYVIRSATRQEWLARRGDKPILNPSHQYFFEVGFD